MRYEVFCETLFQEEVGYYQTYGIRLVDANGKVKAQTSDVSTDKKFVETLAQRCTKGGLAAEHLRDVIEDSLT